MKITYTPDNRAGAERYLVSINVVDQDNVSEWIEQKTVERLGKHDLKGDRFVVLYRGVGFFWDIDQTSTAPTFDIEIPEKDTSMNPTDSLNVTYWVAAEAV